MKFCTRHGVTHSKCYLKWHRTPEPWVLAPPPPQWGARPGAERMGSIRGCLWVRLWQCWGGRAWWLWAGASDDLGITQGFPEAREPWCSDQPFFLVPPTCATAGKPWVVPTGSWHTMLLAEIGGRLGVLTGGRRGSLRPHPTLQIRVEKAKGRGDKGPPHCPAVLQEERQILGAAPTGPRTTTQMT